MSRPVQCQQVRTIPTRLANGALRSNPSECKGHDLHDEAPTRVVSQLVETPSVRLDLTQLAPKDPLPVRVLALRTNAFVKDVQILPVSKHSASAPTSDFLCDTAVLE